jgi:SHS2 domain-containing protein
MFEVLEHVADIGFRASAPTCRNCSKVPPKLSCPSPSNTETVDPRDSKQLTAEGDSDESLLANWLSEVLYWLDGEQFAMSAFKVRELTSDLVTGEAKGEPRDPARHEAKLVVKGVTYHQLRIENGLRDWSCEVYLDNLVEAPVAPAGQQRGEVAG